ncbi:MAG: tetratricopeptide repeat protein [Planctomycetota bacterium]|jgi:hypothetical protein
MSTPRQQPRTRRWKRLGFLTALCGLASLRTGLAQSLEERLDEERFIRGLSELRLPEVLEHFLQTHPPRDSVEAAEQGILAARTALQERGAPPAEREAAVNRVLEIRAGLLREHPEDPRRAVWLADQAADLLFVLLPIDASGLTTELGLPSPPQRTRARRAARDINSLSAEAEIAIERALVALESAPGFSDDIALQIRRRRLAEEERDRRIPFLRGIGAYLHATLNVGEPSRRQDLCELAAELLVPLAERLHGMLAARCRRYAGWALARSEQPEAARAVFARVVADPEADPGDAFAARLGVVLTRAAPDGPQTALPELDSIEEAYAAPSDLLYRVLVADQRFMLHRQLALQAPDGAGRQHWREAFQAYTDLIEADQGVPREHVRSIVFARLSAAAGPDAPLGSLPPIVTVARARHLARAAESRPQAVALLRQLLAREDLVQRDQAEALLALAQALAAAGHHLEAGQRFAQLAREHSTVREAERSIELAATIAVDLDRRTPKHPAVRKLLRETLELLLARYPNLQSIDRWRYAAGQVALADQRFERALALFEQIPPDAEQWLNAQFERAGVLRSWAEAETDPAQRRLRYRQLLDVVAAVRPVIEQAARGDPVRAEAASLRTDLAALSVFDAAARLELGEPQRALESLTRADADPSLDSAIVAEALLIRIDAYHALGRSTEVGPQIVRLLDVAQDRGGDILSNILEARQGEVTTLLDRGRAEAAAEKARRDLVPLAEALDRWLAGQPAPGRSATRLRLRAADAYRLGERFKDALRLYDQVARDHPDALEALFGRAECLFGQGEDHYPEAMRIYKRIIGAATEAAGESYWQSQLRMLQVLDRTRRNTGRIAPHVERLRRKDPQLGGERFRRGFEALQRKYS